MSIYKRGNTWWVYVTIGGKRIRRSAKTSDENKARIVEQTLYSVNKGVTPRQQAVGLIDLILPDVKVGVKVADLTAFYKQCLTDEKQDVRRRTLIQRMHVIDNFVEWAGKNTRAVTVDDVSTDVAFAFSQYLGTRGILGKTLNSYCGDLSTTWKMLIKRGKTAVNPWQYVRVRRDRENEHTGRALTQDELERLLQVARDVGHEWDGMVLAGAYTGLRMPDCSSLKWSEVNFEKGFIDLEPSKTKRYGIEVHVPIHPRLRAYLESVRGTDPVWVMPYRHAHPAGYKARGTDVQFAEIINRAGIEKTSDRDKLSFHCLRHTFVSNLAKAGVPQDVRMRLAGHTDADTHAIYQHDDSADVAAIAKLA